MDKYFQLLLDLLEIENIQDYKKIAELIQQNPKSKFEFYHKHAFVFEGYKKLLEDKITIEDFTQLGDVNSKIFFDTKKEDSISFLKSNPNLDGDTLYIFDSLAKGIVEESENVIFC
ncbi:MAG TPA: hypothetical protein P5060_03760 [Candidatus Absconditabacterales bacterium]|nr:hypothetical protein [Candidatus Absconditabacterales bacterium]